MYTQDKLESFLSEIQEDENIFNYKLNNYSVWAIIKRPLFLMMFKESETQNSKNQFLITKEKKTELIRFVIKSFLTLPTIVWIYLKQLFKNKENILIFLNNDRRFLYNSRYYDAYLDGLFLSNNKDLNFIGIANCKGKKSKTNLSKKPQLRENFIKLPAFFYKTNKFRKNKISIIINEFSTYIESKNLKDTYLKSLLIKALNTPTIKYKIYSFFTERKRSLILLQLIRPKCILLISSEGHLGLVAAAKKMSIPVIEQQHGLITQTHPIYNFPSFMANKQNELLTPNYLFSYGEYWNNILIKMNFWQNWQIYNAGNFKFHCKTKDFNNKNLSNNTIIYSSNPFLQDEEIFFFKGLISQLNQTNINYKIIIKLHPSTLSKEQWFSITENNTKNIDIFLGNEIDIFDLYKMADLHLSIYSAAIYETLALAIPTGIIPLSGNDYNQDLVNKNYLFKFESPYEIINLMINTYLLDEKKQFLSSLSNNFFANYIIENQISLIKKIIHYN